MLHIRHTYALFFLLTGLLMTTFDTQGQSLPKKYLTLELFTNTPCPICGSQNPGLFNRLADFEGDYHLISFYPGRPYNSCVFYQANTSENTTRFQHYMGEIFGTPTVALNGIDFKNSNGVNNAVLTDLTGDSTWLYIDVDETSGTTRTVDIRLEDHAGGSISTGRLFAAIVEREVLYNAPNGETVHHNVFREFLTAATGEDVDLTSGSAERSYSYEVDGAWQADEIYVIAWLSDPVSEEIFNSGTRFDEDFTSSTDRAANTLPLTIFPNPASSFIQIHVPENVAGSELHILGVDGKLAQKIIIEDQATLSVSISDLQHGQYIAVITTQTHRYTGQFQVSK